MSQNYELIEGDFSGFFQAGLNAYGKESNFVSMMKPDLNRILNPKQNPLFKNFGEGTFFHVMRDGIPVGRITAHAHIKSNTLHGTNRACFGFFDCVDDIKVAKLLLNAAEHWSRQRGYSEICGNFNLTAMQQAGIVTSGFENPPYTDQVYNAPHIPQLLEAAGYSKHFPMSTFELDVKEAVTRTDPKHLEVSDEWEVKIVGRWGLRQNMEYARQILNDGFKNNPMFVPVTSEEYFFQAKDMMWILDPRISIIAFHRGEPAGVVVCIPDLNPFMKSINGQFSLSATWKFALHRFRNRRAVVVYYSVCEKFHGKGLMKRLLARMLLQLNHAGYKSVGVTWIANINAASLRQMEVLGGRRLHESALFRKDLGASKDI